MSMSQNFNWNCRLILKLPHQQSYFVIDIFNEIAAAEYPHKCEKLCHQCDVYREICNAPIYDRNFECISIALKRDNVLEYLDQRAGKFISLGYFDFWEKNSYGHLEPCSRWKRNIELEFALRNVIQPNMPTLTSNTGRSPINSESRLSGNVWITRNDLLTFCEKEIIKLVFEDEASNDEDVSPETDPAPIEIDSSESSQAAESASVTVATASENKNNPPPKVAITRLVFEAASEIYERTKRIPVSHEVMKLLKQWSIDEKDPFLTTIDESDGVFWLRKKGGKGNSNEPKEFSLQACDKALDKWRANLNL